MRIICWDKIEVDINMFVQILSCLSYFQFLNCNMLPTFGTSPDHVLGLIIDLSVELNILCSQSYFITFTMLEGRKVTVR